MLSFGAVRVSRERNSLYQGMFIFFSYLIYKEQRLGAVTRIGPRELTCRQISHLSQATI